MRGHLEHKWPLPCQFRFYPLAEMKGYWPGASVGMA